MHVDCQVYAGMSNEAGEVGQDVGWSFGPLDGPNLGKPKRTQRSMPLGDQMGCLAQSFASGLGVSSDLGGSYVARWLTHQRGAHQSTICSLATWLSRMSPNSVAQGEFHS